MLSLAPAITHLPSPSPFPPRRPSLTFVGISFNITHLSLHTSREIPPPTPRASLHAHLSCWPYLYYTFTSSPSTPPAPLRYCFQPPILPLPRLHPPSLAVSQHGPFSPPPLFPFSLSTHTCLASVPSPVPARPRLRTLALWHSRLHSYPAARHPTSRRQAVLRYANSAVWPGRCPWASLERPSPLVRESHRSTELWCPNPPVPRVLTRRLVSQKSGFRDSLVPADPRGGAW